jgi:tetratricopeptide (TPR) repeat protein
VEDCARTTRPSARPRSLTLGLALVAGACSGAPTGGGGSAGPRGNEEAETLYQEGVSWARKAEAAPGPTPDPAAPGVVPEFKPEELRAIEAFEKAIATQPDHAGAHLGLADVLAPHAIRRAEAARRAREAQEAAARARPRRGRTPPPPPPTPSTEPVSLVDASPERVLSAYQSAVGSDPGRGPVDRLIAFANAIGRAEVADRGYQELLRRVKESAEPHVLYGDFLAQRGDRDGAIDQYRQALIWNPHDEPTRIKLAEIYLARGIEYYDRQEFARAAAELRECQKYVTDRDSDLGRRLQKYLTRMREIRR